MKTRIYAELRQSIRCISLSVEVQDRAQLKDVEVSGSGEEVVVRFKDGTGSVMKLPAKGQRGPLAIPVGTGGTLQFRIPLDDAKVVDLSPTAVEVNAPWCVKDLEACKQDVAIHCRNCQADIVSSGAVEEWRALPSSGWAEMMDIWHCHKPTEEDTAKAEKEGQTMKKKYGSGFIEKPGIGLVGLTEIMVHESNCSNIEIKVSPFLLDVHLPALEPGRKKEECDSMAFSPIQLPDIELCCSTSEPLHICAAGSETEAQKEHFGGLHSGYAHRGSLEPRLA